MINENAKGNSKIEILYFTDYDETIENQIIKSIQDKANMIECVELAISDIKKKKSKGPMESESDSEEEIDTSTKATDEKDLSLESET